MQKLIQELLNTRLAALSGSQISGQICIQDGLMNELLQAGVAQLKTVKAQVTDQGKSQPLPSAAELLDLFQIEELRYEAALQQSKLIFKLQIPKRNGSR